MPAASKQAGKTGFEENLRDVLTIQDPGQRAETLRMFVDILLVILSERDHELAMLAQDYKDLVHLSLASKQA